MDLDDFDDLGEAKPSKAPPRVSKFLPKSSANKPPPKPEPKQEPQQPGVSALKKPKVEASAEPAAINLAPKVEPLDSIGAITKEVKPVPEAEVEVRNDEPIVSSVNEPESILGDEDMLVREIDVFFNPTVDADTQLYVMQYPLRPSWRPYELDARCQEVRVKPASSKVEMDLSIDVDSSNWDREKASTMNMTKQTLHCSWPPLPATGYAVGVLIDNKLHLNPIHAVVQLRASMEHLNPIKTEDACVEKSVGPSKKQNKKVEPAVEQKSNDGECWIPLKYHGSKSDLSERYLQRMLAQDYSPVQFGMSPYDYVNSFCPGASNKSSKSVRPSKSKLLSMSLEERVEKLLGEGSPAQSFNALKYYAPDHSTEDLLNALENRALLVQGLWVLKSGRLYKHDKLASLARDYVLLLFSKKPVVKVEDILLPGKLHENIIGFLNVFAVKRPLLNDWKFKVPTDTSFKKNYPAAFEKQNQLWMRIDVQLSSVLGGKGRSVAKKTTAKYAHANKPSEAISKDTGKDASGVLTENRPITNEVREALRKALQKLFQIHKVCSKQFIKQGLRDLAVSQATLPKGDAKMAVLAAEGVDTDEFEQVLSEVATNIHGFYVLRSSPEHPEHDPLRKIVINLLLAGGSGAKLKKADIMAAARVGLKRDITTIEYGKVMSDICETRGSAWILKSGDGKPK